MNAYSFSGFRVNGSALWGLVSGTIPTIYQEHDDIIKWKHFPCYWPIVWGIHQSPVNSPHKGQRRGALMFFLICAWTNGWVNNHDADDLRCHDAHCDITVMKPLTVPCLAITANNVPAVMTGDCVTCSRQCSCCYDCARRLWDSLTCSKQCSCCYNCAMRLWDSLTCSRQCSCCYDCARRLWGSLTCSRQCSCCYDCSRRLWDSLTCSRQCSCCYDCARRLWGSLTCSRQCSCCYDCARRLWDSLTCSRQCSCCYDCARRLWDSLTCSRQCSCCYDCARRLWDSLNMFHTMFLLFTRGQFWPSGIVVACVCLGVRPTMR